MTELSQEAREVGFTDEHVKILAEFLRQLMTQTENEE